MQPSQNYISQKDLKRLSVLTPWRTALAIAVDWLVIAITIAICVKTDSWLLYIPGIAIIAGRMHALAVLVHDFAHYRFIRNKAVSDWVADLLLTWPLLGTFEGYRRNHIGHHRYLNTDKDPDWSLKLGSKEFTFPQEMRFAVLNLLGYLVGVSSVRDFVGLAKRLYKEDESSIAYKLLRVGYYAVAATILTVLGAWHGFLVYWVVPYVTLFFMFMYIRSVSDHFGSTMDYSHELTSTRTVIPYFWETWFFAPHNINYHLEHHLYPSIPFYRLKELHAVLMAHPAYAAQAHLTHSFTTGLVNEIVGRRAAARRAKTAAVVPAE